MSKQQHDNENRGVLFKNDRRESETHPNFKGSINVDGKEYWLSAWRKNNEDGSFKLISVSVQPKEAKPDRAHQARREAFGSGKSQPKGQTQNRFDADFLDDEIPGF